MRLRQFGEPKTSMVKANIRKVCSGRDQPPPPPDDMKKLPYDVRYNEIFIVNLDNNFATFYKRQYIFYIVEFENKPNGYLVTISA